MPIHKLLKAEVLGIKNLVKTHPDFLNDFLERDRKRVLKTLEKLEEIAEAYESSLEGLPQEVVESR